MATDRGVSVELRADELEPAWFEASWLHLSGYALLAEPIAEAALAAVRLARARDARVAVDLSSWSAIRAYGPERFRANLDAAAPDVVFANEPEWEMVGGAYALAETAVVKRGSRGVEVRYVDRGRGVPAAGRRGGRHDRRRRRARGGLPRRRDRARARGGRALRRPARGGAGVTELLRISAEVQQALHDGGPVVALETTLVAHGFPPGVGVEVGHAAEAAVRSEGAMSATVGVLDGQVVVGLDAGELERFGEAGAGGAQGRPARPRGLRRERRARRDDRRRHARGGAARGDPVHGHRRDRRRPPRLRGAARRLRRPGPARAHAGARRLLRDQVAARRPRHRRAARDARRAGARLPHRPSCRSSTAPAAGRRSRPASTTPSRPPARPRRTGSSAARRSCSRATPTTASTSSR